jgi:small subunit ribosomal protein S24e
MERRAGAGEDNTGSAQTRRIRIEVNGGIISMEVEVVSRKENPLLGRVEIQFKITHTKEKTPARDDVKMEIANLINSKKDRVVIDHMNSVFGKSETTGYAKVYDKKETAQNIEREYELKRNKITEEKKKEGKKKEEKKGDRSEEGASE